MTDLRSAAKKELAALIRKLSETPDPAIGASADQIRRRWYGNKVLLRGLIEVTSYCKNDCLYCGLRRSNGRAVRYRLEKESVLRCCDTGYGLGLRAFVLQGGEDAFLTDRRLCALVSELKGRYPDCAVALSLGERTRASYRALFDAGADRYLLRHEAADPAHYGTLHPPEVNVESRKACLYALREIGFMVGAGFMVGTPGQTAEHLAEDLVFLRELEPDMVGIGPFLPHRDTPLGARPPGGLEQTLLMLALTRLMLPRVLLPATTALATLHPEGRIRGLLGGANVVMPNLSPGEVRHAYSLYDNKRSWGSEAAEGLGYLEQGLRAHGLEPGLKLDPNKEVPAGG